MRQIFINNRVLELYQSLNRIRFPIRAEDFIEVLPSCKIMAYSKLAELSGKTIEDIINIANSKSGCTQYDRVNDRFLILYNDRETNVLGRIRWTKAHEIGHVVLEHFAHLECNTLSEGGLACLNNKEIEQEADAFASALLAPFPIAKDLGLTTPEEFEFVFGLSKDAARITAERYFRWRHSHRKTSWENDMVRVFHERTSNSNITH